MAILLVNLFIVFLSSLLFSALKGILNGLLSALVGLSCHGSLVGGELIAGDY